MPREYIENPDPQDDSDPDYLDEIFETYKAMGWSPEKIVDPKEKQQYMEWLQKQK